ncbi:MAG: formyltetrahydrofolate deformylase, partial [Bacteroidia bacterium]|nr:formyltetrahydrofolate deformylase [Bacteroidia bacterium]
MNIFAAMPSHAHPSAILLMHCPDQQGIVAAVTTFLLLNRGNVTDLSQHVDRASARFFMRVEWELEGFAMKREEIEQQFSEAIGQPFGMQWKLSFSDKPLRLAIFVSKLSHCLYDILQRHVSHEWHVEIPLIISNHEELRPVAERFDIPYHVFPITKANKAE